jgi:hypothetical protein
MALDNLARAIPDYPAALREFLGTEFYMEEYPAYHAFLSIGTDADYVDFLLRNGRSPSDVLAMVLPPLIDGGRYFKHARHEWLGIITSLLQKGAHPPADIARQLFGLTYEHATIEDEFQHMLSKHLLIEIFAANGYLAHQLKQLHNVVPLSQEEMEASQCCRESATLDAVQRLLKGLLTSDFEAHVFPEIDFTEPRGFDLRGWVLMARRPSAA